MNLTMLTRLFWLLASSNVHSENKDIKEVNGKKLKKTVCFGHISPQAGLLKSFAVMLFGFLVII